MFYINFFLLPIIFTNCERWFSASYIDNNGNEQFDLKENGIAKTENQLQDYEQRYLPVEIKIKDRSSIPNKGYWHVIKDDESASKPDAKLNLNTTVGELNPKTNAEKYQLLTRTDVSENLHIKPPFPHVIEVNNTITNINLIRKIRPKRKLFRRKCPGVIRRQKKQYGFRKTEPRFLEVFEVVEFEHVPCTSSSGLEGMCLPEQSCSDSGGTFMGPCADGYGTCCVTQFTCEERTNVPSGWFTNPGFPLPTSERLSCTLIVEKSSENVKQIRLDFNDFELLPPTDGSCELDQFVITGQDVNNILPTMCGINTGQHLYIEVGNTEGPINLSVQTISANTRLFSIKVTQLTEFDELAAPSGCLQYYKGGEGHIESFNYRDQSQINIARLPSYLGNLNYAMCIERAPDSCSVTYLSVAQFQIVNYDTNGLPVIPPHEAGVEVYNCPSDWLLIAAVRLCGERFNDGSVLQDFACDAPVTDTSAGPIVVWFKSDSLYTGKGFKLQYKQNACRTD